MKYYMITRIVTGRPFCETAIWYELNGIKPRIANTENVRWIICI